MSEPSNRDAAGAQRRDGKCGRVTVRDLTVGYRERIAVEGVSLTVSAVEEEAFEVSLIPETLERTTLGAAAPGRTVNLEVDVLAKYVEKAIRSHSAEPSAPARR